MAFGHLVFPICCFPQKIFNISQISWYCYFSLPSLINPGEVIFDAANFAFARSMAFKSDLMVLALNYAVLAFSCQYLPQTLVLPQASYPYLSENCRKRSVSVPVCAVCACRGHVRCPGTPTEHFLIHRQSDRIEQIFTGCKLSTRKACGLIICWEILHAPNVIQH